MCQFVCSSLEFTNKIRRAFKLKPIGRQARIYCIIYRSIAVIFQGRGWCVCVCYVCVIPSAFQTSAEGFKQSKAFKYRWWRNSQWGTGFYFKLRFVFSPPPSPSFSWQALTDQKKFSQLDAAGFFFGMNENIWPPKQCLLPKGRENMRTHLLC